MPLITLLGPTAIGKTKIAVALAHSIEGEIISADSRQVYRGMDIGSGKDLEDYQIQGQKIPYHLIDNRDAGERYDLFQFQQDFYAAYQSITANNRTPILCGGTGLYLEAALSKEQMVEGPTNNALRAQLKQHTQEELNGHLKRLRPNLHNTTDTNDRERTLRAIELAEAEKSAEPLPSPVDYGPIFGISIERSILYSRIEKRLKQRLENGLIEEAEHLIEKGLSHEQLQYYGLEYKFLSMYLLGTIDKEALYHQLAQAIRKFAKRQMTWFRRMEKKGTQIRWLDAERPTEQIVNDILKEWRT